MKENTAAASTSGDLQALATAFDAIATMAPSGYTNWASIAKDGAAAARAGSLDAARAACTGCHNQYKAKYKAELRMRPVP
jgi:cytochrome c553